MASNNSDSIIEVPEQLGYKIPVTSSAIDLLCSECGLPVVDTRQASCGCRLCGTSYNLFIDSRVTIFKCKRCGQELDLNEIFKDKAVANKLKRTLCNLYFNQVEVTVLLELRKGEMIYMEIIINSQVQDGYLSTPIQAVDRSMEKTMCVVGKLD